jgi:hypothetical protein
VLLKVRLASSFQTKVHHHGSQKLQSEIRKMSSLIFEYFENHGYDSQAYHLGPWLLGERKTL